MAGNALGVQLEPEKHYRVAAMFPDGVRMDWAADFSASPLPAGSVSGDYATLAAVAASLVRSQFADAWDIAASLAAAYRPGPADGSPHFYTPYTRLTLEGLAAGSSPFLAHHAEGFLNLTAARMSHSASHRPDRQLHGATDFTALIRVIPVGLAYRNAALPVLRQAVDAATLLSHPDAAAVDAANVVAAATAWLAGADAGTAEPDALLQHLLSEVAATDDMRGKLALLQQRLPALSGLGAIGSWRQFWRSKAWSDFVGTANLLMKQNLAVQAGQMAALALWVQLVSWRHPQQAVMLAASLGGYSGTTAALVGGLAGALHGSSWVPQDWWKQLQQGCAAEPQPDADDGHGQEQQEQQAAAEGLTAARQDDADSSSHAVALSKQAVVELGLALAQLDARDPPTLLG